MDTIPAGFCQCGCGERAALTKTDAPGRGYIKGQPLRFAAGHHRKRPSPLDHPELFWARVAVAGPDDCWPWQGAIGESGHGTLSIPGRDSPEKAHRVAWILTNGPIPDGLLVCHDCPGGDNPACCNPRHVFLGTIGDNIKDMWAKGRARPYNRTPITDAQRAVIRDLFVRDGLSMRQIAAKTGHNRRTVWSSVEGLAPERRRASKLTPDDVRAIRERLAHGERTGVLAKLYGVTHGTISNIHHGKVYSNI